MKIRENICITQSRQKANFHNTLRTLQKQNAIQNNNKKKPKQWNEQRTQTRSTLEKKYKWLNKYEKMVNLIILESNLK